VLFAFGAVRWGGSAGGFAAASAALVIAADADRRLGVGLLMVVWSAPPQRGASASGPLDAWRSAVAMASIAR